MNKKGFTNRSVRTGAAFLLLIFLVLLVVLGATQTMVRSEMTARRGEQGRLRVRTMLMAIDSVGDMTGELSTPIRLPIEPSSNEFIEVTVNQDESSVVARWLRGDQVLDEMRRKMTRKLDLKAESGE